ncbi:MAG: nickel pincer cofactor biosynthesis protein LarB [Ignisphaera sp.]
MQDLRAILEALARKEIDVDEALKRIRLYSVEVIDNIVRYDLGRSIRRDVPEIVYGENKDFYTLEKILRNTIKKAGVVIVSRLTSQQIELLKQLQIDNAEIYVNTLGRIAVVKLKNAIVRNYMCRIGIITGGTADIAVAEEVKTVIEAMGCRTITIYDVGIAGFHRVIEAIKKIKEEDVDVVVAIAGMEGALPSVIASLIDVPVIGVPTSIGYGLGGGGVAALYSMLQACPLGLVTVNIDNGVGAGIAAALIGRRIAVLREKCLSSSSSR